MLTRRDLERIRAIVRDEIARALRDQPLSTTASESESTDADLAEDSAREHVKLISRMLGGDRRAKRQLQQLHARERVH